MIRASYVRFTCSAADFDSVDFNDGLQDQAGNFFADLILAGNSFRLGTACAQLQKQTVVVGKRAKDLGFTVLLLKAWSAFLTRQTS